MMLWTVLLSHSTQNKLTSNLLTLKGNIVNTLTNCFYWIQNSFLNLLSTDPFILSSLSMSLKMLLSIALLVFVRGGIPRYRYDYLTKIGWIKILSIVLVIFTTSLLLIYLF